MPVGAIEAGGTKWLCAVGTGPDDLVATETIPTTTPDETIGRALAFFRRQGPIGAVGIGCFGPVDLRPGSPAWGSITTTPKPGWTDTDVAGVVGVELGVPVAFDTDVNAAALGEHRWGAARGLDTFCYVTIGTGIGGGAIAGGAVVHGLVHPEFGHMRIPHDLDADPFGGLCPYHGDCWEGLASGPAIEARWGRPPRQLVDVEAVWRLEARYVALGLVNVVAVLSPERIVLGGGVMEVPGLLPLVRAEVDDLLAGYVATEIVPPALGPLSGVLGAFVLALGLSARP
ncbi:MAG TPA: ROK family protein [Gaiellales bacterium]|nr:ROK family protein [Gaiellales bacterium]